jgi:hypothetical protein
MNKIVVKGELRLLKRDDGDITLYRVELKLTAAQEGYSAGEEQVFEVSVDKEYYDKLMEKMAKHGRPLPIRMEVEP